MLLLKRGVAVVHNFGIIYTSSSVVLAQRYSHTPTHYLLPFNKDFLGNFKYQNEINQCI